MDGFILKEFIERQKDKSKKAIAQDLGMSRNNLYQLFESQELEEETKLKFENYFKTKIFGVDVTGAGCSVKVDRKSKTQNMEPLISIYEKNLDDLRKSIEDIRQTVDALKESNKGLREHNQNLQLKVQANLETVLKNQLTHEAVCFVHLEMALRMLAKLTGDDVQTVLDTVRISEVAKQLDLIEKDNLIKIDSLYKK